MGGSVTPGLLESRRGWLGVPRDSRISLSQAAMTARECSEEVLKDEDGRDEVLGWSKKKSEVRRSRNLRFP